MAAARIPDPQLREASRLERAISWARRAGAVAVRVGSHLSIYLLTALLVTVILREVATLRAEREEYLRQRTEAEALRQADRLKRDLLATVSHDLRTPITVVRGALELLLGGRPGPLEDKQRELATSAHRNVLRLEEFTAELLDMAQLQEGQLSLEPVPVEPRQLIEEVVADQRLLAEQRRQRFRLDLDEAPASVEADPRRLRQMVANLVANAISYAPRGSEIEIRAERAEDAWRLSVRDHGPGVPPAERSRIFDPFYRGRVADGARGSGLGLAIARSLALLHGGSLEYADAPGGGGTFVVSIPLRRT